MLHFHGSYLGLVMKTGLVTGIISLTVSNFQCFGLCKFSLTNVVILRHTSHGLYWFLMVQTGRYCSGKDFCCSEGLQSGWEQGNDGDWADEHCWLLYFLLRHNRFKAFREIPIADAELNHEFLTEV